MKLRNDGQDKEIDPKANYTIVTIDYLVKRGGEYTLLQEGKNMKPLNLTLRDAVIDYVKAETAAGRAIKTTLDGRFFTGQGISAANTTRSRAAIMITRRKFLGTSLVGGAAFSLLPQPLFTSARSISDFAPPLLQPDAGETLITILHTNDTHSQIDPLPETDKTNGGKGGVARRATLVKRVRKENPNTLLVDAGDVFQGTPYFNFYKGEVEYKSMSLIGYDVVTLGNHDFDNGVAALAAAMKFSNFDFVSSNYDVKRHTDRKPGEALCCACAGRRASRRVGFRD